MSKLQQRNVSAFAAGREFRSLLKKGAMWFEIAKRKNREAKRINKHVRPFWLSGFKTSGESGKVRKRRLRRSLALSNRSAKSSY